MKKMILVLWAVFFALVGFASASQYLEGDAGPWTIGVKDYRSYDEMGGYNVSYFNEFFIGDPDEGFGGIIAFDTRYAQVAFQLERSGWYFVYHDAYFPQSGVIKYFSVDPDAPWKEDPPNENHDILAIRYGSIYHSLWLIKKIPVYLKAGPQVLRIYGTSQDSSINGSFLNDFVALYEMPHVSPPWEIGIADDSTYEYYFQNPSGTPPWNLDETLETGYQSNLSEFVVGQNWYYEFGGWIQYNTSDIHFLLSSDETRSNYILTLDPFFAGINADAPKTLDVNINGSSLGAVTFSTFLKPDPISVILPAEKLVTGANTIGLSVNPIEGSGWESHFKWDAIRMDPDCNGNGIPDQEDIVNGTSSDSDENGVPDECRQYPLSVAEACSWISADTDDLIDGDGCEPNDIYKNHGQYMKCVAHFVADAVLDFQEYFDAEQLQEIQSCVISEKARTDVGKK